MASNKEKEKVAGELVQLKVAKDKQKQGVVERASNSQEVNSFFEKMELIFKLEQVIVKDLFKKETNIALFSGLRVKLSSGEEGKVEGGFGQSGKVGKETNLGLTSFEGESESDGGPEGGDAGKAGHKQEEGKGGGERGGDHCNNLFQEIRLRLAKEDDSELTLVLVILSAVNGTYWI